VLWSAVGSAVVVDCLGRSWTRPLSVCLTTAMTILILNQTFAPDIVATAQHLGDLAQDLAAQGHAVSVITSSRAYATPSQRFPEYESWRGVSIERVWATGFGKGARWAKAGRAADFLSFLLSAAVRLPWRRKPDLVIALTTPPLVSVLGALAARLWGARFVYWIMDLNPDEAIAAGYLREGSLAARGLETLSRWSLSSADRIVALDHPMRERLIAKGVPTARIAVISPWSHDDDVQFDPVGRESFRAERGWAERCVVMYSGNHSPCHPLDTLLQAALRLRDDARFVFAFVGGGTEKAKVAAFQAQHQLASIQLLPYQPLERLAASLSAADAQVVVMGDHFVGLIHPCKIYNSLIVGAPIVSIGPTAARSSHVIDAIAQCQREDTALIVATGEGTQLAEALRLLADRSPGELRRPVPPAEAPFSQGRLLARWREMINALGVGLCPIVPPRRAR
jgi:colanic acid biosynthesis glycosyl transferase WcaI